MREAPLRHDRAAARHDPRHPLRGHRDVAEQHAGVDREVVDALLGLLDQRVAVHLPRELFGLAVDLLQRLVDRHRADRHRRVADDPLARLVDVLSRREVHHRVGAPARRPRHLLDFLVDRRGHRRVADVGVDLHQEVAPDHHRLGFRMVDVVRDDRAPARDLVADELRRDDGGDRRAEALPGMLARHELRQRAQHLVALRVLADRDELHFRRHDAAARVVHLRDVRARLRPQRLALEREAHSGELRIVEARAAVRGGRAVERNRVAALGDPSGAQRRQPAADVDRRAGVGVRARRVVDDDRRILLGAERGGRVGLRDLAHRHAQVGARAFDVDLARVGQRRDGRAVHVRVARVELVVGVHRSSSAESSGAGERRDGLRFPAPALSAQVPRV